jgi:flagellin-like protein
MSKSKGISPLIAAVLLIAFTMAVASIFAQWAPQLIQNAQGDTVNQSDEIQSCSSIVLEFVDGSNTTATIQQTNGENNAGPITTTWYYNDASPIQNNTKSIDSNRGFVSYNVTKFNQSEIGNDLSHVEAQPTNCEGSAPTTYRP